MIVDFLKKHNWILILFFIFVLFPQSLSIQSKLDSRVIISAIGIDKTNDGYEVTAQVISPSAGSTEDNETATINFSSFTEKTIHQAIENIGTRLGKIPGLAHMNTIIVGETVAQENLMSVLDFAIRSNLIESSAMVCVCEGNAKELLWKTKNLELGVAISLRKNFYYKQSDGSAQLCLLKDIINLNFSKSKTGIISYIQIEDEKNPTESKQEQDNTESKNETTLSRLKYHNSVALVKEGKIVGKIDNESYLIGITAMNKKSKNMHMSLTGITGKYMENASVDLRLRNKKIKIKTKFKKGIPKVNIEISFGTGDVKEIIQTPTEKQYLSQKNYFTKEVELELEKELTRVIVGAFETGKKSGVDVFNLYQEFIKKNNKLMKEYSKTKSFEEFLKEVDISINVKVKKTEA